MECPSCSSAVADGRRFCPSCGTPQPVMVGAAAARAGAAGGPDAPAPTTAPQQTATATQAIVLPDAEAPAATPAPTPAPAVSPDGATQVLASPPDEQRDDGPGLRERLAPAGAAVGRRADELADRYRTAPPDVRLALVGAVVVVVSFLFLPYVGDRGTALGIGGRLWWRPLAAVAATVLLATTLRRRSGGTTLPGNGVDRLLAALVVATAGATEAGLVGLVSGDARGARIGYYGMLAGLVVVLFATVRAAHRRCGAPVPGGTSGDGAG